MVRRVKSLLPLLGLMIACSRPAQYPLEDVRMLMDTVVRIKVHGGLIPVHQAASVMDSAFTLMERLEKKLSVHVEASETALINRNAGKGPVSVSSELADLIRNSLQISVLTHGAFDISIGALQNLWGFSSDRPRVPDPAEIKRVLPLVDYRLIDVEGNRISLKKEGMRIDLGAIAKGYIVDRTVCFLKKNGLTSVLVEAGGDLRLFGKPPHRKQWRIGIRHPRQGGSALYGIVDVDSMSVTTSGDYERTFTQNGRQYHHLLDPDTGYPAHGCVSVTVMAANAMLADAWATAVFILGPEKGLAMLESQCDVEGLIILQQDDDLSFRATPAFNEQFQHQN